MKQRNNRTSSLWRGLKVALAVLPLLLLVNTSVSLRAETVPGNSDKPVADFKLKPGASGKLCLDCHEAFTAILKKPFVHKPLVDGTCTECHDPHTAKHGKLLNSADGAMCFECHDDLAKPNAKSVHQVVRENECSGCHDPHASDNKNGLLKKGIALCNDCHQKLVEEIKANRFSHKPVLEDCSTCHNSHSSENYPSLLNNSDPAICLKCHKTDQGQFKQKHQNYPVETARCSSCHNPHGSNFSGLIYNTMHKPLKDKPCSYCHEPANSATPFKQKKASYELCTECHEKTVKETFDKDRLHWPFLDQRSCTNCHSAHAAPNKELLLAEPLVVCGGCHTDTIARQDRAPTKHKPVAEGDCFACHFGHSGDNVFLLRKKDEIALCETCHDWKNHTSHPMGEKVIDPRNPNVSMQCASCHRTHGTEYPHFIYFAEINDQCVQCHTKYRR